MRQSFIHGNKKLYKEKGTGKMQKVELKPIANAKNIIQGEHYRITILTAGLIRLEYDEDGCF